MSKMGRFSFIVLFIVLVISFSRAQINHMGYLNVSQTATLSLNVTDPEKCNEYMFQTNYKKVYYDLLTTPSVNTAYSQRIILSDMPFESCPHRCSSEPNYCQAITNSIFSETQATFSKCFPILYIYVVNQRPNLSGLAGFVEEVSDDTSSLDSNLEAVTKTDPSEFNQINGLAEISEVSESNPVFTFTPTHLDINCQTVTRKLPKCASLSHFECTDQAFCSADCALLTCQSSENENLFSVCTDSSLTEADVLNICSSHSKASVNYKTQNCENPIPYVSSLSQTEVSIFLLICVFMTMLVSCVCCYNLRLLKNGEAPCEVCPFCPECLFPREIEEDVIYKEGDDQEF